MTDNKKKILIVEDHPIFRWGLSELINQESDMAVCGEATNVSDAWKAIERLNPDLIIADITLENSDGIDLTKEVNRRNKKIPVLILSMHDQFLYAERALHAGARGYIMKQEAMESVVTAIRQVLSGKIYLNEKVKDRILFNLADSPAGSSRSPMDRLTNRELEVFRMIGRGLTTREIASNLHLSIKTIGTYRERIKEKLNLKHANELVRHAVHWEKTGEIPTESPSP
ncbi:MAG: response regulator transcription factor [Desulfosarcina sp.]|nr:response regulator transcription factor [Desulfosarcina sp.]MBC2742254.1 response regulator transcription factor [Desulfosarcina sp.]MBC2765166.1 response regulator transcription factor [Desulfosarcina sp.]